MALSLELHADAVFSKTFQLSVDMVEAFSRLTGDRSPLHSTDDFARKSFFRRRVVVLH